MVSRRSQCAPQRSPYFVMVSGNPDSPYDSIYAIFALWLPELSLTPVFLLVH
jgi:hypothetical protein